MRKSATVCVLAITLLFAGCGDGDDAAGPSSAAATAAPTTTAAATTTTTTNEPPPSFEITKDLVYLQQDGVDLLLDVYAPDGDGPFPMVLALHGLPSNKDGRWTRGIAKAAAEAGMVVVVPTWTPTPAASPDTAGVGAGFSAVACAMAYAEQNAAEYGGDSSRIVAYGFSAGAPEAAWLTLGHTAEPEPGCVAGAPSGRPFGALLGDSEYFFHSSNFDKGFDADAAGMREHSARLLDASTWPQDLSATFRIWSASNGTMSRPIDAGEWLAQRDPDGAIQADLGELGELDDGLVSFVDEGLLLTKRLQEAGLDATHEIFPGGHDTLDKHPELVAYLLEIASG